MNKIAEQRTPENAAESQPTKPSQDGTGVNATVINETIPILMGWKMVKLIQPYTHYREQASQPRRDIDSGSTRLNRSLENN